MSFAHQLLSGLRPIPFLGLPVRVGRIPSGSPMENYILQSVHFLPISQSDHVLSQVGACGNSESLIIQAVPHGNCTPISRISRPGYSPFFPIRILGHLVTPELAPPSCIGTPILSGSRPSGPDPPLIAARSGSVSVCSPNCHFGSSRIGRPPPLSPSWARALDT